MSDKMQGGVLAGSTSLSLPVVLRKTSDNTEQTGKVAADMTCSYLRQGGTRTAISPTDLASVNSAYSSGGVKEIDSGNMPGLYRLDIPDAAIATGADWVVLTVKVASTYVFHERFALTTNVVQGGDNFARLGTPAGASVSADVAAIKTDTGSIKTKTDFLPSVTAGAAGGVFIAGSNAATSIATALTANVIGNVTGNLSGSVGSVTSRVTANTDQLAGQTVTAAAGVTFPSSVASPTNITAGTLTTVSGNVTGSVGSIAAGGIAAASFAAGAIDAAAIATDAIDADALAADAVTEIQAGLSTLNAAGVRSAVGLASANLDTQLAAIAGFIDTEVGDIQARLPAALVGGRMDASVGAYQSGLVPLQPTTAGRTLDVTATGEAGIDWANIGAPTTTVNLSGTTVKTATDVETDTQDIQSRLPAALVSGRIDASVGAMAAGTLTATAIAADAITAAKIATDAIDSDAIAASAVTEIQTGLSTLTAAGVRTAVGLASANLDTQLSALPTAAENSDAVWDESLAGHAISGSTGEALTASSAGGNPWAVVLEGSYTAQDLLRIAAAVMAGKTTITDTTFGATVVFRDVTDASDIVSANMVGSERAAVTLAP